MSAGEGTGEAEAADDSRLTLVTEDGLPGEAYATLAADGAWCWFGDPRAVTVESEGGRTLVGYVTSAGDVELAQLDHASGAVSSTVVADELQIDDHASPAILVRPDGRLMVFYCGHRGRWMIYRTSSRPADISSWGRPHAASGHTSESSGYTYPNPVALPSENGRRFLFWRGTGFQPMLSTSETGLEWSEPVSLLRSEGATPYLKVVSDNESTIHLALSSGHPRDDASSSIHYLRYSAGTFSRADGTVVGTFDDLPLALADCDLVYDATASGEKAWIWDLALSPSGDPVIAHATFPDENDHRYHYALWEGGRWSDFEIVAAGGRFPTVARGRRNFEAYYSGGMALDHSDPSVVYLSRPVDGIFEIERWTTPDEGRSWVSAPVTSGSASNNVRPLVPVGRTDGGPSLIWMSGSYVSYTDYATSLRVK